MAPSEFWRMTPAEWWLIFDAKRPLEDQEQPTYRDLYSLIWSGEDTGSIKVH